MKRNEKFEKYQEMNEEMLARTDTEKAPWHIVEAVDRRFATVKIYSIVEEMLTRQVDKAESAPVEERAGTPGADAAETKELMESILGRVDLGLSCGREEYERELKMLQERIRELHGELYRRRIPVVLGFEGWDAGGKGGAIKRLTAKMDPRGYVVHPTASPNPVERQYHYLWRFWRDMPKAGQYAADDAFKAKWAQLIAVRDEVKKVLEQARADKQIGASLEASVTLYCNDAVYDLLNSIPMDELADLMIVSHVELVKGEGGSASAVEGLGVAAAHATGEKCERCWKYSADIGTHAAHPTLCARCASVVEA